MGLFKRGKVWWMAITYQGNQIRRSTGTSNKKMAEAIIAKVQVKIIEGQFFDTLQEKERTFDEMMTRYMKEHLVKTRSEKCNNHYLKSLLPFFGQYTLAEITPRLIAEYKSKRYDEGRAPATINRELAAMKAAFNLAIREWEWCRDNPVSKVSMEKENNQRDRWLSLKEEERLLKACPSWVEEIVSFALNTGMRRGEILGLTWAGVDLCRKTVTVFRSKNGERRTIPLNRTAVKLLKGKSKVRALKTNLVFHSKAHTGIDVNNLRRAYRSALDKAKIKDFRFHDLRHTFATRLVQAGVDIYKVQRLLGHKSPTMTQRYPHHYPESLRDGVEILDQRENFITILSHSLTEAGRCSL
ncbi:MAG: tyrosine-type recombinase/integrase [Nitrospiria bacterium]